MAKKSKEKCGSLMMAVPEPTPSVEVNIYNDGEKREGKAGGGYSMMSNITPTNHMVNLDRPERAEAFLGGIGSGIAKLMHKGAQKTAEKVAPKQVKKLSKQRVPENISDELDFIREQEKSGAFERSPYTNEYLNDVVAQLNPKTQQLKSVPTAQLVRRYDKLKGLASSYGAGGGKTVTPKETTVRTLQRVFVEKSEGQKKAAKATDNQRDAAERETYGRIGGYLELGGLLAASSLWDSENEDPPTEKQANSFLDAYEAAKANNLIGFKWKDPETDYIQYYGIGGDDAAKRKIREDSAEDDLGSLLGRKQENDGGEQNLLDTIIDGLASIKATLLERGVDPTETETEKPEPTIYTAEDMEMLRRLRDPDAMVEHANASGMAEQQGGQMANEERTKKFLGGIADELLGMTDNIKKQSQNEKKPNIVSAAPDMESVAAMDHASTTEGQQALAQAAIQPARPMMQEGGMAMPPELMPTKEAPVDTYPNVPPEEMAEVEASQLPDDEMEEGYLDFIVSESLSGKEQQYLMESLEADPQLSSIIDKLVLTASEFTGEGEVDGPGTGVSDSIPARLSDGEFVFTKKATDQLGADNLQTMMDNAERAWDGGYQKFVLGGAVGDSVLGGAVRDITPIEDDKLMYGDLKQQAEMKKQMMYANRMPSIIGER